MFVLEVAGSVLVLLLSPRVVPSPLLVGLDAHYGERPDSLLVRLANTTEHDINERVRTRLCLARMPYEGRAASEAERWAWLDLATGDVSTRDAEPALHLPAGQTSRLTIDMRRLVWNPPVRRWWWLDRSFGRVLQPGRYKAWLELAYGRGFARRRPNTNRISIEIRR